MKIVLLTLLFGQYLCYPQYKEEDHKKDVKEVYTEKYVYQYIDHFNFLGQATNNGQFKQRYLISDKYWNSTGPILFYCGNEGDVVDFWDNTGFMFEVAKKLNAIILFGEHRYYGKSLPYGKDSFLLKNIGFLSIEQTLADFAVLLKYVQKDYGSKNLSVFAFGGSYGGILSGYMRYKYPHLINGAVASSAPFLTIAGKRPRAEFFQSVTETFRKADPSCPGSIQQGFKEVIDLFSHGDHGIAMLKKAFKLCSPQFKQRYFSKHMLAWARNAFTLLAMMDYPYPAKFLVDLPGHPVDLACSYMTNKNKIKGLGNITQLLYGSKVACHNTYREYVACSDPTGCGVGADAPPWDYQSCTEMILPGGSNNITDMFPALPFTIDMRSHYCQGRFGLGFSRNNWIGTNYFGSLEDIKQASRIIFPNGDLDPWGSGGVLKNLSPSLIAIMIKGGAHHLDLRASNELDPPSVVDARKKIVSFIMQWMEEDYHKRMG